MLVSIPVTTRPGASERVVRFFFFFFPAKHNKLHFSDLSSQPDIIKLFGISRLLVLFYKAVADFPRAMRLVTACSAEER